MARDPRVNSAVGRYAIFTKLAAAADTDKARADYTGQATKARQDLYGIMFERKLAEAGAIAAALAQSDPSVSA
jgi:hypothetical protein